MDNGTPLIVLFFLTALVYASVGFGGGSTYLALLVLFQFPFATFPKIALACNCVVVAGGLYHYIRAGSLPLRKIFPFVVASIPCAYWGGRILISKELFLFLLALSLGIAGLRLFFSETSRLRAEISMGKIWRVGVPAGGLLGFLSGLVGIGGGIFLSPLLYFLRWGDAREIAGASSFFIFVNSLFGLWGQWNKIPAGGDLFSFFPLLLAVFAGGQIGSRLSVGFLPLRGLQRITAVLILFVSAKILWRFL